MTPTLIGLAVALLGPMILAIVGERLIPRQSPIVTRLFAIGVYAAIVAVVLFIIIHCEKLSLLSVGVRPLRWQTVVWGLVLAALFMYVFAPVAYWALARFNMGSFQTGLAKNTALPLWYLSMTVVFGGMAEEFLYRGYAIERIASMTGSYWLGGAISIGLFGLAHVPMWGWGPALTTVVSGAVATVFYIWQQDLVALIIAHIITDFMGIVVMPCLSHAKV